MDASKYITSDTIGILLCQDYPAYFADTYFKVYNYSEGKVNPLDATIVSRVSAFHSNSKSIHADKRQSGVTTSLCVYALWKALFKPDARILMAANREVSTENFRHILMFAYEHLPEFLKPKITHCNRQYIKLDNGSTIIFRTSSSMRNATRGIILDLVCWDDALFGRRSDVEEALLGMIPSLSQGGTCILAWTDEYPVIGKIHISGNLLESFNLIHPIGQTPPKNSSET